MRRLGVEECHSLSAWGRFEWSPAKDDENFRCDWHRDKKAEAELRSLDSTSTELLLTLHSTRGEAESTQRVSLIPAPCHYGGARYWFRCGQCGRKVGKLYVLADGQSLTWSCRHCYHLTYEQRRAGHNSEYLEWRADRLLNRHGITLTTQDGEDFLQKPKGMRYAVFQHVVNKYNVLIDRANSLFLSSLRSQMPSGYARNEKQELPGTGQGERHGTRTC